MHPRAKARLVAELIEANRRGARSIQCERCGAPCYRGEDHDEVAMTVTVDTQPLDPVDEMFTVLDGIPTYNLTPARGKQGKPGQHNLHHREPWHVDSPRDLGTVHAWHHCERQP